MISIQERNRQILQLRKKAVPQRVVARRFGLSPSRIYLLERKDAAARSMAERRTKLREEIRAANDPEKMWPVNDLTDAIGLSVVTTNVESSRHWEEWIWVGGERVDEHGLGLSV